MLEMQNYYLIFDEKKNLLSLHYFNYFFIYYILHIGTHFAYFSKTYMIVQLLNSTYIRNICVYTKTEEVCNFLVFFLVIIIKIKGKRRKNPFHFTAAAGDDDDKENDIYMLYNMCCIYSLALDRKKM